MTSSSAAASGCARRSPGGAGAARADRADDPHARAVLRAVSALELIQACALVHDDLMDDSATRRGAPTVHVDFAAQHRAAGWWARRNASARPPRSCSVTSRWPGPTTCSRRRVCAADAARARAPVWQAMRTEVLAGQYLDVVSQATRRRDARGARCGSTGTRPRLTPSSARCTSGRRSPAPTTTLVVRLPPASGPTSAWRSSCATTCWGCSVTRRSPVSPPATTCARASGRLLVAPAPRRAAPTAAATAASSDALGNADLDAPTDARPREPLHRARRGRRGRAADRRAHRPSALERRSAAPTLAGTPAGGLAALATAGALSAGRRRPRATRRDVTPRAHAYPDPTDHVVVVGAGLAGLSAALHLLGAGRRVTVARTASRPGGRAGRLRLAGYASTPAPPC